MPSKAPCPRGTAARRTGRSANACALRPADHPRARNRRSGVRSQRTPVRDCSLRCVPVTSGLAAADLVGRGRRRAGAPAGPAAGRTRSSSHRAVVNSRCIPAGLCSPACSASDQPVLRPSPDSRPARQARARARPSRRKNWPATSANASSNPDTSRAASISSTLASTATLTTSVPTHLNHPSGGRPASARSRPVNIARHPCRPPKSRSAAS